MIHNSIYSYHYENKKIEIIEAMPSNYKVVIKKYWTTFSDENLVLPEQGWKIHLSTSIENSIIFLSSISEKLFSLNLSWKIPTTDTLVKSILLDDENTELLGKFITIYPESEMKFIETIQLLNKSVLESDGSPVVITDKSYKNSKSIYYRYGAFKKMYLYDEETKSKHPAIWDDKGELVVDSRSPGAYKPIWKKDPLEFY